MDLKSKLTDKKMGKAPEPKTEMSLDEALAQIKASHEQDGAFEVSKSTETETAEPEMSEEKDEIPEALTPKGGIAGWFIRHIKNAGPIQKHNEDLRKTQADLMKE
ncbi:MAG: hypothetical protein IPL32_19405 [Chloracidobacterium sp.]|nr:hypothetical protein [Chloracidobacterium sp.]